MSYRFVYPNTGATVGAAPPNTGYGIDPSMMPANYANGRSANMYDNHRRQSYSPGSFSSDSESSDDYEYRGRMITRETRRPRDVVRAPTPPPIIKRVVERAPTPEAPVMERVIIRPQAQEIVERVIEQPRTPPPRIIEKEMHEEAPPPIVRTRVIKVDRPLRSGFSQPGSPYGNPMNGLQSFSNGMMGNGNGYRAHSIAGSAGRPAAFHNFHNENPSFSSGSSFDYVPPAQMAPAVQPQTMMMMQAAPQPQPVGVMQQAGQQMNMMPGQPVQQQMMYRQVPMGSPMPQMLPQSAGPGSQSYLPQNFMFPQQHPGMSFGYRPMMQQQIPQQQQQQQQHQPGRMIPNGMPMMPHGMGLGAPAHPFANQAQMFNPMAQQMVY